MFSFFRKRSDKNVEELERSVKNSFQNMRSDMSSVSQWITHFKTKHDEHFSKISAHDAKIEDIHKRLGVLEDVLATKLAVLTSQPTKVRVQNLGEGKTESEIPNIEEQLGTLPYAQESVCNMLARLQKEDDRWVSLQDLAGEVYPRKAYKDVRSAILQLVNILEVEGYLIKKKVRKSVYVYMKKDLREKFNKSSIEEAMKRVES